MGLPRSCDYVSGGNQPVAAYPLEELQADQLQLEPMALWSQVTLLKFYKPPNPEHVSHSVTNFQNDFSREGEAIEVPATTLAELLQRHHIADLPLLKLDIEGAEIEVLGTMLDGSIRPDQLLIEFDELTLHTRQALHRWETLDRRLRDAGYACGYFDGRSCFLYALPAASAGS